MIRCERMRIAAVLLIIFFADLSPRSWASDAAAVQVVAGWNLLGNGVAAPLDVATLFGDATRTATVWKWLPKKSVWAFYSPALADRSAAYAASKGYEVLSTVDAGEGFWVNAKTAFDIALPAGVSLNSSSFRSTLNAGWNLIASGDQPTPSGFNRALSTTPSFGGTPPPNLITLWSWDAALTNWYFYAPNLEANGSAVLDDYIAGKNYLNFGAKTLTPATGFWVNRPTPPTSITLDAANPNSAPPLSLLTLTGSGFDTTATTVIRFHDANRYSVEVKPIRITSTAIVVAVPPYFTTTSALFAPGTVEIMATQNSGAGLRSSSALSGFTISDLPNSSGPAGSVTLNLLKSLHAQATSLQTAVVGSALDNADLRNRLADQAGSLTPLIAAVESVVKQPTQRVTLGTLRGVSIDLGATELRQTDRLLLGIFQALGSGSTLATPNSLTTDGIKRMQLAQPAASGGCMQAEAAAFAQCAQGNDPSICNSLAIVEAPYRSTPCATPGAVNTTLAVLGAGLVAGVAIMGLIFGSSVAGTAGVLALSGYLVYATVTTGMMQIAIGGTLGQSTPGARQLVEGGMKQLDDFVRDAAASLGVGSAAGEATGLLNDAVVAAKNLGDALDKTVFPTATSSTSSTTTTTTTTTQAPVDCITHYNTCLTKPACNPPTDLITQNKCVNACIATWLACS